MDLQHDKEKKDAEAGYLAELRIIRNGLRQEIELLEKQREQLKKDNEERLKTLHDQMDESLNRLSAELKALQEYCAKLRSSNRELEDKCTSLTAQYEEAKARRINIEAMANDLQAEYTNLRAVFVKILSATDVDPFDNRNFVKFLEEMAQRGWRFDTIRTCNQTIEHLKHRQEAITLKLSEYTQMHQTFEKQIEEKRKAIADLENQMNQLRLQIGQVRQELPQQEYREGAPHIRFDMDRIADLQEDQTAIWLAFREFDFVSGFPPEKIRDIMLSVDFYEHRTENSPAVKVTSGRFDIQLVYATRNDFQLRDYVNRSYAQVVLYAVQGMKFDAIAYGDVSFTAFGEKDKVKAFESQVQLRSNNGEIVGTLNYEAAVHPNPLYT
jgi:archaellum component FlaC